MRNNKGFTITELLVIVAIMLSVLGIAVYAYSKISEKQKLEARKQVFDQVEGAAEQYLNTNEYIKTDLVKGKYAYVTVGTLVENDYMSPVTDPVTGKQLDNCTIIKAVNNDSGIEYNVLTEPDEIVEAKVILGNNTTCRYEPVVIDPKLTRLTVNIYKAEKGCSKGEILDWKTYIGTEGKEEWFANSGKWFNKSSTPYGLVVEFVTSDKSSIKYSLDGSEIKAVKNNERICVTKDRKELKLNAIYGNNVESITKINLDKTDPVCSLNAVGTNGNNGWFISNVNIKFNNKSDNLNLTAYGLAATQNNSTNNLDNLTLASDTKSKKYYGVVKDEAGNIGKCDIDVKRDTSGPSCEIKTSGSYGNNVNGIQWYKSNVNLTLTCNDAYSGLGAQGLAAGSYTYNNQTIGTQTEEVNKVVWNGIAKDNAGNEAKVNTTFGIDKTGPTCYITTNGTKGNYADGIQWYKSNVNLSLDCSDTGSGIFEKGLAASTYTYNGASTGTQSVETKKVTWGGIAKDNAGNEVKVNSPFAVDKTGPSCSISRTGTAGSYINGIYWYRSDVTLGLSCTDSYSGLSNYGLAAGTYTYNGLYSGTQSGETSGVTWGGIAIDKAGNEARVSSTLGLDKTGPSCSISRTGTIGNVVNGVQWYLSDVSLTLSCSDDRSGINDYGLIASNYKYNGLYSGTQTSETSGVTWGGIAKDNAGNEVKVNSPFAVEKSVNITFNPGLSALAKSDSDRTTAKGNLVFNTSKVSKLCGFNTCSNINCRTDSAKTTQCNKKYFARSCWNVDTYPRFFNVTAKSFNNGTTTTVFATDASKSSAVINNVTYYMNNSLVRSQQIFKYGAADNAEKNIKSPYYFNDVGVSQHATWRNDFSAHKYQYTSPAGNKSNQIRLYTEYIADCGYSYK